MAFRTFASRAGGDKLGDNFKFPNHKEFFNDEFYDEPSEKSPYSKTKAGPQTIGEDYVDPNNPFVSANPYVDGGILSSYKKRAGLTANEVVE